MAMLKDDQTFLPNETSCWANKKVTTTDTECMKTPANPLDSEAEDFTLSIKNIGRDYRPPTCGAAGIMNTTVPGTVTTPLQMLDAVGSVLGSVRDP